MYYKKLILSGGGIKGIAFIGALQVLDIYNLLSHFDTFLGCSAGAIVSLLIYIGYTPKQLYKLFTKINFANYHEIHLDKIITEKGLDSGNKLMKLLRLICHRKGVYPSTTFQELYNHFHKTLIIVGTNITTNRTEYFSHQLTPSMPVLKAIRISISYPYLYKPVLWNNCVYVDGGLLEPFPIKYFGKECQDVLGILIHDRLEGELRNNCNDTIEDFSLSILSAIIDKITEISMEGMVNRYIHINIKNIHSMNFHQDSAAKELLYQEGMQKTYKFFKEYYLIKKYLRRWINLKKTKECPVYLLPYNANNDSS